MAINVNMTKKDIINAKNSSVSIKEAIANNWELIVSGVAVVDNGGTSKSGEPCDIGYIATDKGIFGFTSNVLLNSIGDLADYLADTLNSGEVVKIKFNSRTSKSGSEFYTMTII